MIRCFGGVTSLRMVYAGIHWSAEGGAVSGGDGIIHSYTSKKKLPS